MRVAFDVARRTRSWLKLPGWSVKRLRQGGMVVRRIENKGEAERADTLVNICRGDVAVAGEQHARQKYEKKKE